MLLRILSFSTSPIVTLSHSLWYVCFCGYPHCTSSASTSTQSNASGGGALCVTAGDTRAKRGGTRGQADYSDPDAGSVALKAWRGNSDVQKWGCCATPPVSESGLFLLSTGSPFGHHPRLSMGCPRWGQWVRTRDTQLISIPAYRLCSCGYSRSLLRRSSLLSHSLWYVCLCGYPHPLHLLRIRIYTEPPPVEAHHA